MNDQLIIPQSSAGQGGIGGGRGIFGQASQLAEGSAARGYGIPVIRTTTGMKALFDVQLTKDLQGTIPSDLKNVATIKLVCLDQLQPGNFIFQIACTATGNGMVHFCIMPQHVNNHQGLHRAQFVCCDSDNIPIKIFKCYMQVLRGIYGQSSSKPIPLTIQEVRMAAYDTCAQKNVLLDDLQFSDMQIAYCMQKALDDWNQRSPQLADTQTIGTFPFRSNLSTGVLAHLFRMAANRYLRNGLRHSNAGLSFDDQDKGQIYSQLAQQYQEQWFAWMDTKKTQLNALQCMGVVCDGYMDGKVNPWWY